MIEISKQEMVQRLIDARWEETEANAEVELMLAEAGVEDGMEIEE